ncbi:MAG: glycosyl transferase family 1, partial [Deltaproteobacteria bacterium]|nr:glycosyl transferase family 1 [Deltaproteobacteria bacterium]
MNVEDYRGIAEEGELTAILEMAKVLRGKTMLHVNSTSEGGGVAELLQRMLPIFKGLGINARWEVLDGTEPFFEVTKRIHNTLQGLGSAPSKKMWDVFEAVNEKNAKRLDLDADLVFI